MFVHTGIISFCDRVRYNIKSSETKDVILGMLERKYHIRILQRHWYRLDETTAPQLKKAPHWACLRSNGNPYFMVFTRFDDTNIIYFIDKKVQPGYEKPRIILGRGMFHDDLFQDTILDGEMVRRTDEPGWVFLINDVIAYCGRFLQNVSLPERIPLAYDLLGTKYIPDPIMDVCSFSVKRYVETTREAVAELTRLSETLPYTNRGVYFWCHNTRLKPKLYNFDDGLIKSVHRKVKDAPEFRDRTAEPADAPPKPPPPAIPAFPAPLQAPQAPPAEGPTEPEKMLWLRKTENPDIFDVFTTQQCSVKLGNAYVASLVMSKRLRGVFRDLTVASSVPFWCAYNKQFEKWSPLRQAEP